MSWSLNVPKQETPDGFEAAIYDAKASPKSDGRTKIGRAQAAHVRAAKYALYELGSAAGALSGTASGHVNPDLSATVSVSVTVYAP